MEEGAKGKERKSQEGIGAGGARGDPGHSHNGDPWVALTEEEAMGEEGLTTPRAN